MNSQDQAAEKPVLVAASGLGKDFDTDRGRISPLRSIDLSVREGEMVGIMGPSGSGKSTLLFILGLLLSPSRGTYRLAGRDLSRLGRVEQARIRRNWLGFVFQSADLVEGSTVFENVELPLIYAEVDRDTRRERIEHALDRVNLLERVHHPANRLSGGERQRVAIARGLVNQPRLILADEPTGQLDLDNGRVVMDHFERIVHDGKTAVIVVTHDHGVAARCTRICQLRNGVLQDD